MPFPASGLRVRIQKIGKLRCFGNGSGNGGTLIKEGKGGNGSFQCRNVNQNERKADCELIRSGKRNE